ncbi:MAG: TrmH family RNA methyltransferase [Allosphingosinicella sp.]
MSFYTYLLRCADGSYYVGHTDDLDVRIAQHERGELPGYSEKRRPVVLVWSETFPTRDEAFAAERRIKGWSRAKKEALIAGDWKLISQLAKKRVLRYAGSTSSPATQDERTGGGRSDQPHILSSDRACRGRVTKGPAIVLVRPQLGENIGKAARAMLNFGLTDLRLVSPRDGWPNPSAGPAASGADVVLEQARVFDSVAQAVADCPFVFATTVRKRGLMIPVVSPEDAAREIRAQDGRSAILFGAERSGLETEEVALAGRIVTVPVNPGFRSLNLAQAVILLAYEWSKGADLAVPTEGDEAEPRAPQAHLEGLIGQLFDALEAADYFHPPDRTPTTKNTIRTILTKPDWSSREIQALRGIVRALVEPRRGRPPR